jgi:hypothetical protein
MQGRADFRCRTKAGTKEAGTADDHPDALAFYEGDGKMVKGRVCGCQSGRVCPASDNLFCLYRRSSDLSEMRVSVMGEGSPCYRVL